MIRFFGFLVLNWSVVNCLHFLILSCSQKRVDVSRHPYDIVAWLGLPKDSLLLMHIEHEPAIDNLTTDLAELDGVSTEGLIPSDAISRDEFDISQAMASLSGSCTCMCASQRITFFGRVELGL